MGRTSEAFHIRMAEHDRDAAPERYREVFPTFEVRVHPRPGEALRFEYEIAGDASITWHRSSTTISATISGDVRDTVLILSPMHGGISVSTGRHELDTTHAMLNTEQFSASWNEMSGASVGLDAERVQRTAQAMLGDPEHRLRFTGTTPLSAAADRYWRSVAQLVETVLSDAAQLAEPMLRAELFRTAAHVALRVFPNTAAEAATDAHLVPRVGRVEDAVSFLEANAHRDITADDAARTVGLPSSALTRLFRERFGSTPLQFLRAIRLQRTHDDLVRADAWSGDTVAVVARRWGFSNLGRFAAEYRGAFDELPSTTLRR